MAPTKGSIHRLSRRKLKAFDRKGGAYLALPWPADLPPPIDLGAAAGDERKSTQSEHLATMPLVAELAQKYALVHIATTVARLKRPTGLEREDAVEPHLLAHMVSMRWQGVTKPGAMAPVHWLPPPS